jgi:uncharacterized protein (DUF486 family)
VEWWDQFMAVAFKFFPANVIGLAVQRGFILGPIIAWSLFLYAYLMQAPGSWAWYRANYIKRVKQCQELAELVAPAEADAEHLKGLISLLNELRSTSIAAGGIPQLPVTPVAPKAPMPSMPPLPGALPPMPSLGP